MRDAITESAMPAAPAVAVTADGGTHWLECFAGDPDSDSGEVIRPLQPGDSWTELVRDVAKHVREHGCGSRTAAP